MKKNGNAFFMRKLFQQQRERERDHSWEVNRKVDWIEKVQETLFFARYSSQYEQTLVFQKLCLV